MVILNIRSRSPKSEQIFKPSQCYNIWSLARIRPLVQEIGCRQVFFWSKYENFTVFIVWWIWKLGHGSPKSEQIFKPSQRYNIWSLARICPLVQDRVQTSLFFFVKIWNFHGFYSVMNLKIRSRSPKSNQIFKPSQRYNIWSLARIRPLVQEIGCRQVCFFFVKIWKFHSFYSVMNLKIRSRSPKSEQIFKPSQRYNIWSLARICPLVQEIGCRQVCFVFCQNMKLSQFL